MPELARKAAKLAGELHGASQRLMNLVYEIQEVEMEVGARRAFEAKLKRDKERDKEKISDQDDFKL